MGFCINNRGDMSGVYQDVTGGVPQTFLLSEGKFSAFLVPQSSLTWVTFITDDGRLVGYSNDQSGNPQAFIATPKHRGDCE